MFGLSTTRAALDAFVFNYLPIQIINIKLHCSDTKKAVVVIPLQNHRTLVDERWSWYWFKHKAAER